MGTKIGTKAVEIMPPNSILWDSQIKGLCARRQFSDVITYSVVFRTHEGLQRWFKLGRHPILTPHLARQEAIKILRSVVLGDDPSAHRQALRNAMTVAQLCDDYRADMESGRINGKKASTIKSDHSRIERHIKPKLGKFKVATITSDQIDEFMHSLTPGSAKRIMGSLGGIFTYAVKKKFRADNPVRGIEIPSDNKKTRRLSNAEYRQFWKAISDVQNSTVANVFTMIAISGWRSGEVRCLKWSDLEWKGTWLRSETLKRAFQCVL
jgi:Phage integrase central domain/Arm DNA-binding domain